MPAPPLNWKKGEGFDIHLLRGGPASKPLIDALDIDPGQRSSVVFIPKLAAGSDRHGVEVRSDHGIVSAVPHPDPTFPRVRNFILVAIFSQAAGVSFEAEIRVHIHDAVKDLWLTPPTLTIHKDANECRFTVLARFTDDCVGDITDWPQLTFQSGDPSVATVSSAGVLKAEASSGSSPITVNLKLTSLGIDMTSPPAKVLAKPSWEDVAKATKVSFVAGKLRPNESNPFGPEVDSVKSVVENATNVLFIAEGFRHDQRFDFRNIVNLISSVLRGDEAATAVAFQPFNILKNSINYWVVFVPSEQDGITCLGKYIFTVLTRLIGVLVLPHKRPDPAATKWNWLQLMYEVGLPLQADAVRPLADLVGDWQKLFGNHVTEDKTREAYDLNWKHLPFHSVLNERDTAFGMTVGIRPRAQERIPEIVELQLSSHRTSVASLQKFLENLTVGGFPIGSRWKRGQPDFGLVGFMCLTDRQGGMELSRDGYFGTTTGRKALRVNLKKASDSGLELETGPVISTYRHLMASVVAHEYGHALGLGDEYGDGGGAILADGSATNPVEPNVQAKVEIAPAPVAPGTAAYDPKKIRWAWPRITKAGVLTRKMEAGDVTTAGIRVSLRRRHGRNFAVGDVVRFKTWPVLIDALFDLFIDKFFKVKTIEDDAVIIIPVTTTPASNAVTEVAMGGFDTDLFLIPFTDDSKFSLIKPLRRAGIEIKLVPELILKHIEDTDGPLNADPAAPAAACVAAGNIDSIMTPRNIPALPRFPRTKADIIGIYEGGGYHDCGVFRPAGRCKMRGSNVITLPFCYVCRYIIVDTVDPSRHAELDLLYPEVSA